MTFPISMPKSFILLSAILALCPTTANAAGKKTAAHTPCALQCLSSTMSELIADLQVGQMQASAMAPDAEVRENTRKTSVDQTSWIAVKSIRSRLSFFDPQTGNALFRAGVEMDDGRAGYISTRLKVVDSRITEVEISSDTSNRVVASYVHNLPRYDRVLPARQRISRAAMLAIMDRYFGALTTHAPIRADFDDARCNRIHSGQQVTNNANDRVEGGAIRTCFSSMDGPKPWIKATEMRYPLVDTKRGIVLGIALLHYADGKQMYISEFFKIESGKIISIDNIGLMMQDVATLGFDDKS
jgi:hypothetical protein